MVKIIEINTCNDCPYLDHNGRLQAVTHYVCRNTEDSRKIKVMDKDNPNIIQTPKWCSLQNK